MDREIILTDEQLINKFLDFQAYIPELLQKYQIPGVALSFIKNAELKKIATFGLADVEKKISIKATTKFQLASISKSISTWGILKAAEEFQLDLDAPINAYLTRWKITSEQFSTDKVTIRRLLSHTAGLSLSGFKGYHPDQTEPSILQILTGDFSYTLDEFQTRHEKKYPHRDVDYKVQLIHEPGSQYDYSGGGITVLQLMVEDVSGMSFETYMRQNVLDPLNMNATTFNKRGYPNEDWAIPYGEDGLQIPYYIFPAQAAGGIDTTIEDLSKFMIMELKHIHQDPTQKKILSPDLVKQIYTPIMEAEEHNGIKMFVGLGHYISTINDIQVISHSGGHIGWITIYFIIPQFQMGLAILTNGANGMKLIDDLIFRLSALINSLHESPQS